VPISSADEFQAFLDLTTPTEGSQGPFNSTGVHEGAKSFWRNVTFAHPTRPVDGASPAAVLSIENENAIDLA